jgi:LPXTG-motif cell wall-anchored protein
MIGAAGVAALAAPAQATGDHHKKEFVTSAVEFADDCDGTTVAITAGNFLETYNWFVNVDGVEFWAEEVEALGTAEVPVAAETGELIEVGFEGSPEGWPVPWTWTEPDNCEEPEEPEEPDVTPEGFANADVDCETFSLTLTNDSEEAVTLSVVPSVGDAVEVTVEGGSTSEPIEFPVSEGLIVDVQDGEGVSVLEEGPFEITADDLAECEEDGEGGELPVTGMSTGLIALGALALLAVGGGLFLVARRRRITFTA